MPANTRQNIKQKMNSIFDHFDWLDHHNLDLQAVYSDGIDEYEQDYTEHLNDLRSLQMAQQELRKAYERFQSERV